MNRQPTISVVITVKGKSSTLEKAIHGFLNQTIPAHELIVVSDNTPFTDKNRSGVKRVKYIGEKNSARNKGFLVSKGEYILFSDHDMIPNSNLLKECLSLLPQYDALIIPEAGSPQGSFLQRIYSLEKELVSDDPDALTPRLFRKSLFSSQDLPFDSRFGVLDEWGFNLKLKNKHPRIGIVQSFMTVEDHLNLFARMKKNFQKGRVINKLLADDSQEASRRINPITRGIIFYGKRLPRLFQKPFEFSGLLFIKFLDLLSFYAGYMVSFLKT